MSLPGVAQRFPETGPCRCRVRSLTTARFLTVPILPRSAAISRSATRPALTAPTGSWWERAAPDRFSHSSGAGFRGHPVRIGRVQPLQSRGGGGAGALAGAAGQGRSGPSIAGYGTAAPTLEADRSGCRLTALSSGSDGGCWRPAGTCRAASWQSEAVGTRVRLRAGFARALSARDGGPISTNRAIWRFDRV